MHKALTNREARRKSHVTGEELGLCDNCLSSVEETVHVILDDDFYFMVYPYYDIDDDFDALIKERKHYRDE